MVLGIHQKHNILAESPTHRRELISTKLGISLCFLVDSFEQMHQDDLIGERSTNMCVWMDIDGNLPPQKNGIGSNTWRYVHGI
jgi:hypothetical protein